MRIVTLLLASGMSGCACGPVVDTVNTNQDVAGDANSSTTLDDVAVEEANVDADTQVDADVNVEDSGNVDVDVNIGTGRDDASNHDDDGGATARGDGFVLEATYQGPVDERVDLVPSFDDALAIDSIEWLVRGPVLDTPTLFDDGDGFAWGAPQLDDVDDALDEYTLAVRFIENAGEPFAWTTASSWCVDGVCDGRAVSAACTATIVLRVWLSDGTSREAAVDHESARPACW
jgi:hypothetical protein